MEKLPTMMAGPGEPSPLRRLGVVALLGAALAGFFEWRRSSRAAPSSVAAAPAPAIGGCRFAPEDLCAWRLTQRFAQGADDRSRVTAVLTTRTASVDAHRGSALHAATLSGLEVTDREIRERLVALRGVAFAVRTEADCTLSAVGFPAAVSPASAEAVRGLLRPFEVVMPTGIVPSRWSAQQHDGSGDVAVRYRREDAGFYSRERLRYVGAGTAAAGLGLPTIVRSSTRFAVARDGRWLATLEGEEVTSLPAVGGAAAGELRAALELHAVPAEWTVAVADPGALEAMDFAVHPVAPADAPVEPAADPAVALALDPALARLGDLFDHRRNGAADEALAYALAYLRAHPERALEILARMRRRDYPDRLGALTFFAMGRVRDARVRDALVQVVEDEGFAGQDRMRAAFAVADGGFADVAAVEHLARVAARPHPTPDEEVITDSALNAVGTLRAGATGDVAAAATAALRTALANARTPEALGDALDAIGNSRDQSFLDDVRDAAANPTPSVRQHAATALGGMDDATVEATLAERLRVETDPATVVALVRALEGHTSSRPSDATVGVAIARLPDTADVDARLALVALVGDATPWNGSARAALAAWFPRERDVRVQVAIGRYVPAEALIPAR